MEENADGGMEVVIESFRNETFVPFGSQALFRKYSQTEKRSFQESEAVHKQSSSKQGKVSCHSK